MNVKKVWFHIFYKEDVDSQKPVTERIVAEMSDSYAMKGY